MGDIWKCPKCGAILQKGASWMADGLERGATILGTATCGRCHAAFSQHDVYSGKYDIISTRPHGTAANKNRPRSITVISWLLIIAAGINTLELLSNLLKSNYSAPSNLERYIIQSTSIAVMLVGGLAILKGRNWARMLLVSWWIAAFVMFVAPTILSSTFSLAFILPFIPNFVVIYFLFKPKANEYFGGIFRKSKKTIQNMNKVAESTNTSFKKEVLPSKPSDLSRPDPSHPFQPIERIGSDPWTRGRFKNYIDNENKNRHGKGLSFTNKVILVSGDGLRIDQLNYLSRIDLEPGRWVWFEFILGGKTPESLYIDVLDSCAFELLLDRSFKGDFNELENQVGTAITLTDVQKHAIQEWFTAGEGYDVLGPQWQRRSPRVRAIVDAKGESTSVVKEQETNSISVEATSEKGIPKAKSKEQAQHNNANKKIFLPECFLCKKPMEEVEDWGAGLHGGDIMCPYCKERHHYMISRGEMTLIRVVIPIDYEGETETKYFHSNTNSEKGASKSKEDKKMADYSLVKDGKGQICGIWFRNPAKAQDQYMIGTMLTMNGAGHLMGQQYRVVPNKADSNGGCFVMFGGVLAPGE